MAKYIGLVNWTDQGIKNVKESPARADAARDLAKKYGCEVTDINLTIGAYDLVVSVEAPDDASLAKFLLALGGAGSIRTTTLRAFPEVEYRKIVGDL